MISTESRDLICSPVRTAAVHSPDELCRIAVGSELDYCNHGGSNLSDQDSFWRRKSGCNATCAREVDVPSFRATSPA